MTEPENEAVFLHNYEELNKNFFYEKFKKLKT